MNKLLFEIFIKLDNYISKLSKIISKFYFYIKNKFLTSNFISLCDGDSFMIDKNLNIKIYTYNRNSNNKIAKLRKYYVYNLAKYELYSKNKLIVNIREISYEGDYRVKESYDIVLNKDSILFLNNLFKPNTMLIIRISKVNI